MFRTSKKLWSFLHSKLGSRNMCIHENTFLPIDNFGKSKTAKELYEN